MPTPFHVSFIFALTQILHEVKEIPSGELYARIMAYIPNITLEYYQSAIDTIKNAGLCKVENHLIRWTGPNLPATKGGA